MSSTAPSTRLGWRLLPGVTAAAAAVIAAGLMIATLRDHPIVVTDGSRAAHATAPAAVTATAWRTDSYPVGTGGQLSKEQRARFRHQKDRVRATVRDLADVLSHDRTRLNRAAGRLMTPAAKAALLKQAPGLPRGATDMTVVRRTGRIGLQAPRFDAAAARLTVVLRATIDGSSVTWRDRYNFWLHRADGKWRVIAFDLDRVPR